MLRPRSEAKIIDHGIAGIVDHGEFACMSGYRSASHEPCHACGDREWECPK
jgi:hypothetical protein